MNVHNNLSTEFVPQASAHLRHGPEAYLGEHRFLLAAACQGALVVADTVAQVGEPLGIEVGDRSAVPELFSQWETIGAEVGFAEKRAAGAEYIANWALANQLTAL